MSVAARVLRLLWGGLVAAVLFLFGRRRSAELERARRPEPVVERVEIEVGADRAAERAVIGLLLAAAVAFGGFVVFYVAFPDTQLLGLCLGLGALLAGVALALAGKRVVPQEQVADEYHDFGDPSERAELDRTIRGGGEGITRRRLLWLAGGTAAAAGGAAALAPIASLGPSTGDRLFRTPWRAGRLVVGTDDEPILATEIEEAMFLTAFPEAAARDTIGAPLIIVRLPESELDMPPERLAGAPEGIIAFSKICPHAGCAVSMYRHPKFEPTEPGPALVCPCHYSTFDPRRGGALEFGPAGRALPQLPLRINDAGELEAAGDFFDPPGPSYGGIRTEGSSEERES